MTHVTAARPTVSAVGRRRSAPYSGRTAQRGQRRALVHDFPMPPPFEAGIKIGNVTKVFELASDAARSTDGRFREDKALRPLIRSSGALFSWVLLGTDPGKGEGGRRQVPSGSLATGPARIGGASLGGSHVGGRRKWQEGLHRFVTSCGRELAGSRTYDRFHAHRDPVRGVDEEHHTGRVDVDQAKMDIAPDGDDLLVAQGKVHDPHTRGVDSPVDGFVRRRVAGPASAALDGDALRSHESQPGHSAAQLQHFDPDVAVNGNGLKPFSGDHQHGNIPTRDPEPVSKAIDAIPAITVVEPVEHLPDLRSPPLVELGQIDELVRSCGDREFHASRTRRHEPDNDIRIRFTWREV
jgi:hypothetical protein